MVAEVVAVTWKSLGAVAAEDMGQWGEERAEVEED